MEWIKCSERMPIELSDRRVFQEVEVIVTDGSVVGTCEYQSGNRPLAWAEWSKYGDIESSKITHWMPLPPPPTE